MEGGRGDGIKKKQRKRGEDKSEQKRGGSEWVWGGMEGGREEKGGMEGEEGVHSTHVHYNPSNPCSSSTYLFCFSMRICSNWILLELVQYQIYCLKGVLFIVLSTFNDKREHKNVHMAQMSNEMGCSECCSHSPQHPPIPSYHT